MPSSVPLDVTNPIVSEIPAFVIPASPLPLLSENQEGGIQCEWEDDFWFDFVEWPVQ